MFLKRFCPVKSSKVPPNRCFSTLVIISSVSVSRDSSHYRSPALRTRAQHGNHDAFQSRDWLLLLSSPDGFYRYFQQSRSYLYTSERIVPNPLARKENAALVINRGTFTYVIIRILARSRVMESLTQCVG